MKFCQLFYLLYTSTVLLIPFLYCLYCPSLSI